MTGMVLLLILATWVSVQKALCITVTCKMIFISSASSLHILSHFFLHLVNTLYCWMEIVLLKYNSNLKLLIIASFIYKKLCIFA